MQRIIKGTRAMQRGKGYVLSKKSKIYKRLLLMVLSAIMICVVLCSGAVYLYLKPLIETSLVEKNRSMILKMAEQISNSLEEISLYASNITFDETVQKAFDEKTHRREGSYEYYSVIQTLEKKLKEYQILRDNIILDIFAVDSDGIVMETRYQYEQLMKEDLYERLQTDHISGEFLVPHMVNYYRSYGEKNTIAYVNDIFDKSQIGVKRGKLFILADVEKIISPLVFDEDEIGMELHDQSGRVIYSNVDSGLEGVLSEKEYYKDNIGSHGWYICYQVAKGDISGTMRQMNNIVISIIVISLLVMLSLVAGLVQRIITPLDTLVRGMQSVAGGSREARIEIHTGDECEQAANVFNSMVKSINEHTEKLLLSEKKQYDSQLKMLSYQLNPHFIYNTLNAVICLARKQDYQEIIRLTRSFILLLRSLLLTDLQAMASVEEEKEYICRYVEVLQICYKNIPNIKWEIDETLLSRQIPRMILYPLVENSIFHGIIPSNTSSLLRIVIAQKDDRINITVEDDGVGCTEEERESIRLRLESERTGGHIGMFNVNGRLKLIYEEVQPLKMEMRPGGGTIISFAFSKPREERDV